MSKSTMKKKTRRRPTGAATNHIRSHDSTIRQNAQALLGLARTLAATAGLTWIDANNAIFCPSGPFARSFPTKADRVAFGKTDESRQIDDLIDSLPEPPVRPLPNEFNPKFYVPIASRRTISPVGKRKPKG
jgi:hypothetical protein